MGVVGNAMNSIGEAREGLEASLVKSPEEIRAAALNTVRECYQTVRGSGSVLQEVGNLKDALVDLPLDAASKAGTATLQLLSAHPVDATCTLASGLKDTCGNLAKMSVAPIPMSIAAAETALGATKKAVTAPVKGVLNFPSTVMNGCERMVDFAFGESAPPPANNQGQMPAAA